MPGYPAHGCAHAGHGRAGIWWSAPCRAAPASRAPWRFRATIRLPTRSRPSRPALREYLLKPCAQEELGQALERACRAADKMRKQVVHLYGERTAAGWKCSRKALLALCREPLDPQRLEKKLCRKLPRKTAEDPSLLREALARALTRGADGGTGGMEKRARWWRRFQKENGALSAFVARCLLRLRNEDASPRGFVQQMTAYVDAHYVDDSRFPCNTWPIMWSYERREITRAMGQKFSAYLLAVRMERAKQLMAADSQCTSPSRWVWATIRTILARFSASIRA